MNSTGDGGTVGLARLSLTRGLNSAANSAVVIIAGYAAFVFTNSAFLTGLLDTAYTLAFAATSYWLTIIPAMLPARAMIVVSGLVSAAITAVVGLMTPLNNYAGLLVLVLVIGVATGVKYPAWFSVLRQGRDGSELRDHIGTYESFRVGTVLVGTAGGGLAAHLLGLEPTYMLIAAVYVAGVLLALTFPKSDPGTLLRSRRRATPADQPDVNVRHRLRLLLGLLAAIQLMLAPIVAVTPVLAVRGTAGGVASVGILSALYSVGGALQFLKTKAVARGVPASVLVVVTLALMLVCAVLAAVWSTPVSAGLLMASFGFGVASIGTLINAEIQVSVPESVRDKYVSTFALAFALPLAVGCSLWGFAAEFVRVPTIAVISTLLIAALLPVVWWRVRHR